MKLTVNGVTQDWAGVATLADLLMRMDAGDTRVATLVNDDVVPADRRSVRMLADGDRVEIVSFAGGG